MHILIIFNQKFFQILRNYLNYLYNKVKNSEKSELFSVELIERDSKYQKDSNKSYNLKKKRKNCNRKKKKIKKK